MRRSSAATHVITIGYKPADDREPSRVQLYGEMSDWLNPITLEKDPDGSFATQVSLPAGVYAYKFVVDGEWQIDPNNPRTRSTNGSRNSVLSIGGTEEPVL